ncbi:hypothetical protein CN692_18300 [Bacillus sp. AFS002410]|uniref:hypothetical protein n=1 Tax=Bacillus sp. AFS002410 TaxID=2033481 RepID=UPI000BF106CF|nr:hypothetical protein [Bacillus sp. AFS002410]PEJ56288.1 hypothetical protein CN692_18300 [Bacillus sp. AFS002410]
MILRLLPTYFFSLEYLYLYLIVLFLYESKNQLPPTLAMICIFLIGNLILFYSLNKSKVSRVSSYFAAIFCGVVGYNLGLNSVTSILCASFIFFRIEAFLKDTSLWNEERNKLQIIFYFTSLFVLFFAWPSHYEYKSFVYGLIIMFTILFSLGRYFQQAVITQSIKNSRGMFGSILIAAILTGIFTLVVPLFKWGIFKVLDGLFKVVGFVASPIFNFADHKNFKVEKIKLNRHPVKNQIPQNPKNQHFILESVPTWVWLAILIIVLIAIWFVIRKLKFIRIENQSFQQDIGIEYETIPESMRIKRRLFKANAPTDHIRKLIFQLQKYASKHKMGRHNGETLNEWFKRIQISNEDELINAYNSVRYGKAELKDIEKYEEQVKRIKEMIRNRDKEQR